MTVTWSPRTVPLAPRCAVGREPHAARGLLRALLARDDAALAVLEGVAGGGLVAVLGESEALPWAPGLAWFGLDPAAPGVLLPTALAPSVPPDLLARAVLRRCGDVVPVAVLTDPMALVPLGAARPLGRDALQRALQDLS